MDGCDGAHGVLLMPRKVIVVGAGLGGLSAAISLRQMGHEVEVFEKNEQIGGKLNRLAAEGFVFDLGPSILTLPAVFEKLFAGSGKRMGDYIAMRALRPHWRNFFEDGKVVDLYPEAEKMAEVARKVGEDPENVRRFLEYSAQLYDLVDAGYFQKGLDTSADFARFYKLSDFLKFDPLRNMHGGVKRFLKTPHMRDIFDYFIKYVGSSAFRAPAFMNCLPTIQFREDLWYVDGGLYGIARGLEKLMAEIQVVVRLGQDVREIRKEGATVTGILTGDGTFHAADVVVSNMEVVPAYRELLKEPPQFVKKLEKKLEPACSGLVLHLGVKGKYEQLAHHNFFYSMNQKQHFKTVFGKRQLPKDPTIYLVAASRSDETVAPAGCEALKILPHVPHIEEKTPLTCEEYMQFKDVVIEKLERMGLTDLRKRILFEHCWTPLDIQQQYYSNKGAIYGVVADRFKNFAFKASKQSEKYANLFFVGGSVNPGGGMPMVVLCGQHVARRVTEWLEK
jgi:diapolycopene oxygenase